MSRFAVGLTAAVSLLLSALPVVAADGDDLLACYVGRGAVELRQGATAADALAAVSDACLDTDAGAQNAAASAGSEEPGDYVDYVHMLALAALGAIEQSDALNQ